MRCLFVGCVVVVGLVLLGDVEPAAALPDVVPNQGNLQAIGGEGESLGACPLKHTDVQVSISGFVARVTVTQQFHNPFDEKIEAVYTFPLSQNAAVDRMVMKIGKREIRGEIKEREEARRIYEQAKAQGKVASLLDQERPNIFTQAVANIMPGEQVEVEISYGETLDWEEGLYQFDFPMVVGPRYIPGSPIGANRGNVDPFGRPSQPTDQVPDANRITPPVAPKGMRAGHDISMTVEINAGIALRSIKSKQHKIHVERLADDESHAVVTLERRTEIPNRDFVLEYETATDEIEDTVLSHTDERGRFFVLVLQPPKRVRPETVVPRELCFVIDKSGSMSGFPIETAKRSMQLCIEQLGANDTFNLMTFAGGLGFCFDRAVPNTAWNRRKAQQYLANLQGSGGTEMMAAINACLASPGKDPERLRVVCFMTDGFVGNDMAIIDAVRKNAEQTRVFSFGIGRSVNRFLLDGMAGAGRGEVHYVLNEKQVKGSAERFYERVRMPVLCDVALDFEGVEVEEVYPKRIPDLFSVKPVVVVGRYKKGGSGTITLRGRTGKGSFERAIPIDLPDEQPKDEVLASIWARSKIKHLTAGDLTGIQQGSPDPAVKEEILGLGLRYRLLTQFTSFVAVEHRRVTEGGKTRTVIVPVEMPKGVSHEGTFGQGSGAMKQLRSTSSSPMLRRSLGRSNRFGGGMGGGGMGGGFGGGMGGAGGMGMAPNSGAPAPANALPRGQMPAVPSVPQVPVVPSVPKLPTGKPPVPAPDRSKLSGDLQRLADLAARGPLPGNMILGKVRVTNGQVRVRVTLGDFSKQTLAALKQAGFQEIRRDTTGGFADGTLGVRQLDALAAIGAVKRIDPA